MLPPTRRLVDRILSADSLELLLGAGCFQKLQSAALEMEPTASVTFTPLRCHRLNQGSLNITNAGVRACG